MVNHKYDKHNTFICMFNYMRATQLRGEKGRIVKALARSFSLTSLCSHIYLSSVLEFTHLKSTVTKLGLVSRSILKHLLSHFIRYVLCPQFMTAITHVLSRFTKLFYDYMYPIKVIK